MYFECVTSKKMHSSNTSVMQYTLPKQLPEELVYPDLQEQCAPPSVFTQTVFSSRHVSCSLSHSSMSTSHNKPPQPFLHTQPNDTKYLGKNNGRCNLERKICSTSYYN